MITVKTNKDLYITNDTAIPEFADRITDIVVPSGTEFNVVDILIDREGEAFGNSHTAFLCDNFVVFVNYTSDNVSSAEVDSKIIHH